MSNTYSLLDSGHGKKLERFGSYTIIRPASQAIWNPQLPRKEWEKSDAVFTRKGGLRWTKKIDQDWTVEVAGIRFLLSPTEFGHLGVFPEQMKQWKWMESLIQKHSKINVLNLFAYSGGATLAAARAGAHVCHLDASKGMVTWARQNAKQNQLDNKPIRWITDDVMKFMAKEVRRGNRYEGIILDPPTFGKGTQGQVFKFEEHLMTLLQQCRRLLSDKPLFFLLSCHTPNITPLCLQNVIEQVIDVKGVVESGEMVLEGQYFPLPQGVFARWSHG